MRKMTRQVFEQAPEIALRFFGRPLGSDPEAADVLRYYFVHQLGWEDGEIPGDVRELDLPDVPELFRLFQTRAFGDRVTGAWTHKRRQQKPVKPKPGL